LTENNKGLKSLLMEVGKEIENECMKKENEERRIRTE
jgi:hypothetical protein